MRGPDCPNGEPGLPSDFALTGGGAKGAGGPYEGWADGNAGIRAIPHDMQYADASDIGRPHE